MHPKRALVSNVLGSDAWYVDMNARTLLSYRSTAMKVHWTPLGRKADNRISRK